MALELTPALIEPTKGTVTYPREGASAGLSCCLKLTPSMKNVVRLNWANIAIGAIPNNRVARTFSFLFGVVLMFIYYRGIRLSIFCYCAAKIQFLLHLAKLLNELLHEKVKNKPCPCVFCCAVGLVHCLPGHVMCGQCLCFRVSKHSGGMGLTQGKVRN